MRWPYVIPIAVVAAMVAVLALGLTRDPRRVPSPLIGKPAPDFSLPALADPNRSISREDLLGHVSVINVWASWCVSCRAEQAALLALSARNAVAIYGLDYKDQRGAARQWLEQFGNPYTAVAFDQTGDVGINWGVYGVPETFVVDKHGTIRKKFIGALSPEDIDRKLLPLIRSLKQEG